jgi:hypothetical protein
VSSDLEQTDYRSLSPLAVVGFVLGLSAPVAFLSPLLILVPLAGIVFSLAALRQIGASDGTVIGRPVAVVGLVLSTICAIAIPAEALAMRYLASRQARPVAMQWFDLLANNDPYSAVEMTNHPAGRLASGPELPDKYVSNETLYKSLQTFVNDPAVRALLALGDRATVRYYMDAGFGRSTAGDVQVAQIYAVTYHQSPSDEPTTFFVQVALEKIAGDLSSPGGWRILSYKGGDVLPKP